MATIKREEVKKKFTAVEKELDRLRKLPKPLYATASKYIPKVGYVHELETVKQILKAQKTVDAEREDYDASAKKLEIDSDDIEEENVTFMGFAFDVWDTDIKNRLEEIKTQATITDLERARKVLKKNLSSEDKFDLEMESIGDVMSKDFIANIE